MNICLPCAWDMAMVYAATVFVREELADSRPLCSKHLRRILRRQRPKPSSLRRYSSAHITVANLLFAFECFFHQGGKYGIRLSLGAQECDVYDNVMSDSTRYGVFFYRGSDEAEVSYTIYFTPLGPYRRCKAGIPVTAR